MRGRGRIGVAVVSFLVAPALAAPGAWAQELPRVPLGAPSINARVPLDQNFSIAERITIVGVGVTGVTFMAAAPYFMNPDHVSIGPPEPGSLDYRLTNWLSDSDDKSRFLWRVPDIAGMYVLPYLPAMFYGAQAIYTARTGLPLFAKGDLNGDHRLWAYIEALGWTALLTGLTKVAVGRTRPYAILDNPQNAGPERERDLSFFSGHSASMFCAASFVAADVSDTLHSGALRKSSPATRFLLGTVVPYAGALGLATLVGVSRVIDQQHWASDVFVGGLVGTAAAQLAYIVHFDNAGRPRRRLGEDALGAPGALALAPMPGGVAFRGLLP
jgi:membrane-associated phospholipid phosphatase